MMVLEEAKGGKEGGVGRVGNGESNDWRRVEVEELRKLKIT